MDRKDIPNLIGKHVVTTNLTATEGERQSGWVVGWSEERERFAVKMDRDGLVELFKPYNLCYAPIPQNEKEYELLNLVETKQLVEFEHGMDLFGQLGSSEEYMHTWLKIRWLTILYNIQAQQDKRYIPKIQAAVENIIETSQFEDLVVSAKIQLALILAWAGNIEYSTDLGMSCVGAHYGLLPELFSIISDTIVTGNMEFVKDIYFQSKQMIENKTCSHYDLANFIDSSTLFLQLSRTMEQERRTVEQLSRYIEQLSGAANSSVNTAEEQLSGTIEQLSGELSGAANSSVNTEEEIIFLRKTLELSNNSSMAMGRICMMEGKYEEAIRNVQIWQETITSSEGNVDRISECYVMKMQCYLELGNKSMAKKVLRKLKRFRKLPHRGLNELIVYWENKINAKTQCSSYECNKVEPHVGAFKQCGRCRLKYYCSKKCQKKHWKNGHKEECQEKMSNTNSTTEVEENARVRTRTQCSFYECKKVEPYIGAFKHCGRCRLKYYCSIRCQKKHWKNGHEEECQEFEN